MRKLTGEGKSVIFISHKMREVLRISDHLNDKGYRPVEQFKEGCIGCAMCAMTCPDAVIEVYRETA